MVNFSKANLDIDLSRRNSDSLKKKKKVLSHRKGNPDRHLPSWGETFDVFRTQIPQAQAVSELSMLGPERNKLEGISFISKLTLNSHRSQSQVCRFLQC